MTEKFRDFDAFWEEQEDEPIRFRALGRDYELPPSPRASLILEMKKLRRSKGMDAEIPEEQVVTLLEHLIGEDEVRDLIDAGLTLEQLEDLLEWIGQQYGMTRDDEDGSGNP